LGFCVKSGEINTKTQKHNNTNTQKFTQGKRTHVSEKKTKTIGLELDVWRALKQMSLERDSTLSETVDFLMQKIKEQDTANARSNDGKEDKKPD
jgi:macrodomain Ter protein organizer (MatP/YcbG family)